LTKYTFFDERHLFKRKKNFFDERHLLNEKKTFLTKDTFFDERHLLNEKKTFLTKDTIFFGIFRQKVRSSNFDERLWRTKLWRKTLTKDTFDERNFWRKTLTKDTFDERNFWRTTTLPKNFTWKNNYIRYFCPTIQIEIGIVSCFVKIFVEPNYRLLLPFDSKICDIHFYTKTLSIAPEEKCAESPLKCCSKSFSTPKELEMHKQINHRTYNCNSCNNSVVGIYNIRNHVHKGTVQNYLLREIIIIIFP